MRRPVSFLPILLMLLFMPVLTVGFIPSYIYLSSEQLRGHVERLAGGIGERNMAQLKSLRAARDYIRQSLEEVGYQVSVQAFLVAGQTVENVIAEKIGATRPREILIVGAHYDSVVGSPGADDNASGVAALLALARYFADIETARTIRFVAFANEEMPYFGTDTMGSLVYARSLKASGVRVIGMMALESLGYYTEAPGSQSYPFPLALFHPKVGNFVGFVGNAASGALIATAVQAFRAGSNFPVERAVLSEAIPGISWSDHWAFWQAGFPAFMVTDTAPYRNPHYHEATDRPETLDYPRFFRVVEGLSLMLTKMAGSP